VIVRTIVVALAVSAAVVGCGGGTSSPPPHRVPASRGRVAASAAASLCVTAPGFGGLGGRAASFDANNNGTVGPAGPSPGTAWYEVLNTRRGCVVAYSVQESATPPLRPRQMLSLVSRTYLPEDAERVARGDSCIVWKSPTLKAAVGVPYARAVAAAQTASLPGIAVIEASPSSSCRSSGK
jgi:hypothetical protein